jgi:hypothetical protein
LCEDVNTVWFSCAVVVLLVLISYHQDDVLVCARYVNTVWFSCAVVVIPVAISYATWFICVGVVENILD